MSESNPLHQPASRVVEITDEHETLLIAFVPVGPQLVLLPVNQPSKGKLQ